MKPKITKKEIEVIKAAQKGSIPAFNRIFKRYKPFVDNILYKYIRDEDEAKDITNIVFLKVYEKLSKFTNYESFGGWLRRITNNTAIDYLRKMNNKPLSIDNADARLAYAESVDSNENDLVNRYTYEQLLEEFNALSENAKKVCELFYVNNLTSKQISEALKMSEGTVKSHLSRSRSKIKKIIKQKNL